MDLNIEEILKNEVKQNIEVKIDKLIEDEINDFTKQLLRRKDDYIAEIMKGIRILHERDHFMNTINYKIIFENITYLESKGE
jgi:hypothetical protein